MAPPTTPAVPLCEGEPRRAIRLIRRGVVSTARSDVGDSNGERERLRELVAAVDHELSILSGRVMGEDPAKGQSRLSSSWAALVERLALGPAPELRRCPVCARFGQRDATRCGYCWTKLSPSAPQAAPGKRMPSPPEVAVNRIGVEGFMPMIRKIVMATDFSPYSERGLEMAIDLAARERATLTLLHVCSVPYYAYAAGDGVVASSPDLFAEMLADAKCSLAAVERRLAARKVVIDTVCLEGEPRDAIPGFAAEHEFDLIVVGSHGRRGFRRFFLGSVAEQVVRAATVPVLVVHAGPDAASVASAA